MISNENKKKMFIAADLVSLRMFSLSLFYQLTQWTMICSWFRFAHVVHSDVTLTIVLINNCRLTTVRLVEFKSRHFELIARWFNQRKNKKSFENNRK